MRVSQYAVAETIEFGIGHIERLVETSNEKAYWHRLDQLLQAIGYGEESSISYIAKLRKNIPECFVKIKNRVYVDRNGIVAIIKMSNKLVAHEAYDQLANLAFRAMDSGMVSAGPIQLFSQSEYVLLHKTLGAVVSTKKIAECFGKSHKHVLRDFEDAITELQLEPDQYWAQEPQAFQLIKSNYTFERVTQADLTGTSTKELLVSEGLFNYIVLAYKGPTAKQWRVKFIDEFLRIKQEQQKLNLQLSSPTIEASKAQGYLYIMKNNRTVNQYKIGITSNEPELRARQMCKEADSSIELLWVSPPCLNYKQLEKDLHKLLANKSCEVDGSINPSQEWFELELSDFYKIEGALTVSLNQSVLLINLL